MRATGQAAGRFDVFEVDPPRKLKVITADFRPDKHKNLIVETNILVFNLAPEAPDAPTVVKQARERDVLIFAFGPRTIRAVTHLNVSTEQCERAADILVELAESVLG